MEFKVPLWDFDLLAETLPGRGMGRDNVHLTIFDHYDYTRERAFETGYGLYNLTALMMLFEIWQEMPASVLYGFGLAVSFCCGFQFPLAFMISGDSNPVAAQSFSA